MCQRSKLQNAFEIFVDRIEGRFAVCEMPDETMCDIDLSAMPDDVKERDRFLVRLGTKGNIEIINKICPKKSEHTLPVRLIRF